jgi:hypothetical protein
MYTFLWVCIISLFACGLFEYICIKILMSEYRFKINELEQNIKVLQDHVSMLITDKDTFK